MPSRTRALVRHFVRGYLSVDLVGGERQAALAAAFLISPGLFVTVLLCAKYVITPFAIPGLSALGGFADRLLLSCASMIVMALVAVVQWDRLALDARDAAILGVLPLRHGEIVRAKWIATGLFAGMAAALLNGLPGLIYPVLSVGRLEATWGLVLQLTMLQLVMSMVAGLLGFVAVLVVREGLWAMLGARRFARVSAATQAALVFVCVLAFFLLPNLCSRAIRDGSRAVRWLPPVVLAGAFEELAGHRVLSLPSPALPGRVARLAAGLVSEYQRSFTLVRGSTRRGVQGGVPMVATLLALLLWNNRRRLEAPLLQARGTDAGRAAARLAWRVLAPRPAVRAGATFAWRTLLRSQPHRLLLTVGLSAGLAAATLGMVDDGPPGVMPSEAHVTRVFLSLQALIVICLAAGIRAALRRSGDARAAWLFPIAWNRARPAWDSGVTLAAWLLLCLAVSLLGPLWWTHLTREMALRHAVVGGALALALAELLTLTMATMPLVEEPVTTQATRALPLLMAPVALMSAAIVGAAERRNAVVTATCLVVLAGALHVGRRRRGAAPAAPELEGDEAHVALGLHQ